VDVAAEGRPIFVEQPVHGRDVPEVEELELGDDLALLGALVGSIMNGHGFKKTSPPKLDRAARQRAGVGLGVEDRQAVLERVVDRPAGRELDDQRGRLAKGRPVSLSRTGSSDGAAWWSRMCTWIIAAPAASQETAAVTSSSSVTGNAGASDFAVSAPWRDRDQGGSTGHERHRVTFADWRNRASLARCGPRPRSTRLHGLNTPAYLPMG